MSFQARPQPRRGRKEDPSPEERRARAYWRAPSCGGRPASPSCFLCCPPYCSSRRRLRSTNNPPSSRQGNARSGGHRAGLWSRTTPCCGGLCGPSRLTCQSRDIRSWTVPGQEPFLTPYLAPTSQPPYHQDGAPLPGTLPLQGERMPLAEPPVAKPRGRHG